MVVWGMLNRQELERLSKPELVDLVLALQDMIAQQAATIERLEARVTELEQRLNQNSWQQRAGLSPFQRTEMFPFHGAECPLNNAVQCR